MVILYFIQDDFVVVFVFLLSSSLSLSLLHQEDCSDTESEDLLGVIDTAEMPSHCSRVLQNSPKYKLITNSHIASRFMCPVCVDKTR
jgi:hypothetical protein